MTLNKNIETFVFYIAFSLKFRIIIYLIRKIQIVLLLIKKNHCIGQVFRFCLCIFKKISIDIIKID